MKKTIIAFDVDGTLRKNSEEIHRTKIVPNDRIIELMHILGSFKNVEPHIWSNRGAEYCRRIREEFGLEKLVRASHCHQKLWLGQQQEILVEFSESDEDYLRPDIAIDDQQRFDGGIANLIVKEK